MALHAATVGILIDKSKFEPEVALGVAEAIELAMTQAQFVTVPILDARLHEIKTDLRVLQEKVDAKLDASTFDAKFAALEARFDSKLAAFEAKFDTKFSALEARVDTKSGALEARLDTKFAAMEGRLNTRMAELEAKLVRWVFLVMVGNVAVTLAANALANVFKSF